MHRIEKEITNSEEIKGIMRNAQICRVGMVDGDKPYIVPVNFVATGDNLYFHCATKGKKMDILRKNSQVCFEMEVGTQIIRGESPCDWGMKYLSVIGTGQALFITSSEEKVKVLNLLMEKYSGHGNNVYPDHILQKTMIVGVKIETLTGKKSPGV